MSHGPGNPPLPQPTRSRWQPLRAGLVDLFYYDAEEFWFRDGRLLLRGNNGTGKSKVLALLVPFLLDADLSPRRVEPDADPSKRMEWNLLLGGEHPHPERLGYTWLEFGRLDDDGAAQFRTIGCGLKAVAGRGIARHWFFLTPARVGPDLRLVDATGTALTRERLIDALDDRGAVYDTAREYRRAVDEALFSLGEARYGALVDLLVQLRQPQLSKRPSERALSDALTEALPPLDQAIVADVAEAFRSLEADRDALTAMSEAHAGAAAFLEHYRGYARVATRRRAALPRDAQGEYERARAALAAAEAAHAVAEADLTAAEGLLAELGDEEARLLARQQALRERPEMHDGARLRAASEAARQHAETAQRAHLDRDRSEQAVRRRELAHADALEQLATAEADAGRAGDAARDAAARAGLLAAHEQAFPAPDPPVELDRVQRELDEVMVRQERALTHVDQLVAAQARAQRAVDDARRETERTEAELAALAESRAAAEAALAGAAAALVEAVRTHLGALREAQIADPAAVLAAVELWAQTLDGEDPCRAGLALAAQRAADELGRSGAELTARQNIAAERRAEIEADIARLEAGESTAPPLAHTLDPAVRTGVGAPLWRLIDFTDGAGLDAADRAGLEAALEAAGILDAWLAPDGTLRAPASGEVLLRPGTGGPGPSLATVLRPAVDRADPGAAAIADEQVAAALSSIGLAAAGRGDGADAETWVDTAGGFGIGVLTGRWTKPAACYIGAGARDAHRRARLVELRAQLGAVEAELAVVATERGRLAERRDRLAAELAAAPDTGPVRNAHAALGALAAQAARGIALAAEAAAALGARSVELAVAQEQLLAEAGELNLPTTAAELAALRAALTGYRLALAALWPALRAATVAAHGVSERGADLAGAQSELADRAALAQRTRADADAAEETRATLQDTVGAAVAELERLLAAAEGDHRRNTEARRSATAAKDSALRAGGEAEGTRRECDRRLEAATTSRADAAAALQRFAGTGLIAVAVPDLDLPDPAAPWSPDPTVRLARQLEQALAEVPAEDAAWARVQRRVNDELKTLTDALARRGNTVSAQMLDEGIVVDVLFHGRPATVPDLVSALAADVADRARLLDEREREILENHLVNEVASTLQELVAEAETTVRRMNDELTARPTSTGMRLKLEWSPREDGPAGLAEARRRLLRQSADAWSAEDRAAVGGFLQQRIAEVRARDEAGTWLEHLTAALDYRAWHRFAILRHQNGAWRSATGPASGGERVLAASVPLFAAASAHYASAGNPDAPRLITLDEAFAGVDDDARAKYFGLLASFDLDVVMTSEREWGCYPEVPGLSIAQLSRVDGVAAVLVSTWQWDGSGKTLLPRPVALASVDQAPAPVGLFDDA